MAHSFSATRLLAAFIFLLAPASAIVVTYPLAGSIWTQGSANNTIDWAVLPLTVPPPLTQYFDIWIRNGIGSIYPAPNFLNQSIATNIDYLAATSYTFDGAADFKAAYGYQLFLAAPGDANLIYTESEVFFIAAPDVSASSSSSAPTTSASPSSSLSGASSAPVTSTESVASTTSSSSTASSITSPSLTPFSSSVTSSTKLHAATVPGGLLEQGVSVGLSSASRGVMSSWLLAAGGIVGYFVLV